MTKSTGAMALRRRREELFAAEVTLRRVLLHVMAAIAWATSMRAEDEHRAQTEAYGIVRGCYEKIVAEQRDPR